MRVLCCLIALAASAFAQIDPDTITVVARGSSSPARPDLVIFDLTVETPLGRSLEEVLKAVAVAGVTEKDLIGVSSQLVAFCLWTGRPADQVCNPDLAWSFRFGSPASQLNQTLAVLARAATASSGVTITYSARSDLAQSAECAYPTLVSQARRHAENLAAAAGVRVGRVTGLSDAPEQALSAPAAVMRAGDFSPMTLTGFFAFVAAPPYIPAPSCAVAVQFQLLR